MRIHETEQNLVAMPEMKSTPATESPISAEVLRTVEAFDALYPEWDALFRATGSSVFQSFEWLRTWWRHFGEHSPDMSLHVVVMRGDTRIVGIAPLFVETVHILGFLSFRKVAFISREMSDYLDVLVEKGLEQQCANILAAHLRNSSPPFDIILLEDVADNSVNHRLLFEALVREGLRGTHFVSQHCPRTALHETWEDTLASFSNKHRKHITYQRKNIGRNFEVTFERTTSQENVRQDMEDFIALHQHRWTESGYKGVFGDDRPANFHRDVAAHLFKRGWLFLTFLRLNGKRIAANYGFQLGSITSTYLNGMIEYGDASKFSPGRVLHAYSIEEAIRNGASIYDFLRGRERYKYFFDAIDVPNWTIICYRPNSRLARTGFKLDLLRKALRRRIERERLSLKLITNKNGFFSKATALHIVATMGQVVRDGMMKLKAPEKSLTTKDE